MIEKYINDTIDNKRKYLAERMEKLSLIPPLMLQKMRSKDSLQKVKEVEKTLRNELKNIKDTLQSEDNPTEAEVTSGNTNEDKQPNDTPGKQPLKTPMVVPEKQRKTILNKKDKTGI
jgi:DNA-binding ferritin-like protein